MEDVRWMDRSTWIWPLQHKLRRFEVWLASSASGEYRLSLHTALEDEDPQPLQRAGRTCVLFLLLFLFLFHIFETSVYDWHEA